LTEVAAGEVEGGWVRQAFFWGGLVATLLVVVVVTRIAGKAMKKSISDPQGNGEAREPSK
jgi:hypothetical protein